MDRFDLQDPQKNSYLVTLSLSDLHLRARWLNNQKKNYFYVASRKALQKRSGIQCYGSVTIRHESGKLVMSAVTETVLIYSLFRTVIDKRHCPSRSSPLLPSYVCIHKQVPYGSSNVHNLYSTKRQHTEKFELFSNLTAVLGCILSVMDLKGYKHSYVKNTSTGCRL